MKLEPDKLISSEIFSEVLTGIGNDIVKTIIEPWSKAWIQVEMRENDNGVVNGFYKSKKTFKVIYIDLPESTFDSFRKLRMYFEINGYTPWTCLTFSMDADGSFETDYSYESLDGTDEIKRRIDWEKINLK